MVCSQPQLYPHCASSDPQKITCPHCVLKHIYMGCGLLMILLFSLVPTQPVQAAGCNGNVINPALDIEWACIFPIIIGGVPQGSDPNPSDISESTDSPICACVENNVPLVGLTLKLWEPARIIDSVTDPYCMMPLGTQLSAAADGKLAGTYNGEEEFAFSQGHYYQFPAWAMLDLFMDVPCLEKTPEFDIAMMTEVLPTWNNDIMSLILHPESILFANPVASAACIADSISSSANMPLDSLFWCMGSWGSAYPLSGTINATDYIQSQAGIAARMIYLMGRSGLLLNANYDGCSFQYSSIWQKSNYRLQLMQPVKDSNCLNIGKSGLLWSHFKNKPHTGDNFSFMMFRKVKCCATYNYQ